MSDRLKMPPERDFGFYQRRKHDKWREVPLPEPPLEAPVADSHAHIHMLPNPAWELARCAANGVGFVCEIVDPSEDGSRPFDELADWEREAASVFNFAFENGAVLSKNTRNACPDRASTTFAEKGATDSSGTLDFEQLAETQIEPDLTGSDMHSACFLTKQGLFETQTTKSEHSEAVPARTDVAVRVAVGVHPHNAKLYDDAIERELRTRLADPRVVAVGEFGLDYLSAFPGCAEQTEPGAQTIAALTKKVTEEKIPAVFHTEFSSQQLADSVCEATGAEKLLFHSCHNVSKSDFDSGVTYLSLMRQNFENLRKALQ